MEGSSTIPNRGPVVLAVAIGFLVVSFVFVFTRLISRAGVVRKVSWDDYFIVLAWLIAFGFSFSICWGTHLGLGLHENDVKPERRNALKKAEYAFSVLYNPALMATKTSILVFYLSLSKNQQVYKWLTVATLIVVNAAGIALTLLNIFQCHPIGAAFQLPLSSTATCTDIVTLYLSSAPVNIVTDLAILFLPMPILTAMRLPRKEKIVLVITFSFGLFVAVVDVARIGYLESASLARLQAVGTTNSTGSRIIEQDDFSWYASLSFMWSAIEVHVGIICACVPALKPLVSKLLPNLLRDSSDVDQSLASFDETSDAAYPSAPTSPTKPQHTAFDGEKDHMGMMDFLTMPDMTREITHAVTRTQTTITAARTRTKSRVASPTFFDFVNMKKPKSMVKMNVKESLYPVALVTILFFLWGFAYGLLDVLNSQFELVVKMSTGQSLALHSAYFGGYFFGPLTVGGFILKKWGFKSTFITGLCVYGCGTLIFWPSAVLTSFPAFLISNFIVGLGLSTVEVGANLFVSICGPPEYAEMRLNVSQGIQAIGSVVSPLLAKKVLFKSVLNAPSLIDVQWAYLGIALFDVLLAVAFYYLPIPEASDEDLEDVAENRSVINTKKFWGVPVVYITLAFGVFSQFCYVGGQEAVAGNYQKYVAHVKPNSNIGPFNFQVVGHTAFAVGRFMCAFADLYVKPRRILLLLFVGLIITAALAMSLTGYAGIAMIVTLLFFESGVFPLTFAISLRGLGRSTKNGSIFLTAATSGGAIIPVIMTPVSTSKSMPYSFCVVVAVYAFGALFPVYLSLVPDAKKQVDPVHEDSALPTGQSTSRTSKVLESVVRRSKRASDLPTTEHVEEKWPG